jgi:hypothetical protein
MHAIAYQRNDGKWALQFVSSKGVTATFDATYETEKDAVKVAKNIPLAVETLHQDGSVKVN